MKLFNLVNAHNHFWRLIEKQNGVLSKIPEITPFGEKACIWFDDTVFHIYAQFNDEYEMRRRKNRRYVVFLINIWIAFPNDAKAEDALSLEKYLDFAIKLIDKKCSSYIGGGKSLIAKKMWDRGDKRPHLFYTFRIENFPVRTDIVNSIKNILREAHKNFNFSYSDSKEELLKKCNEKHIRIGNGT